MADWAIAHFLCARETLAQVAPKELSPSTAQEALSCETLLAAGHSVLSGLQSYVLAVSHIALMRIGNRAK